MKIDQKENLCNTMRTDFMPKIVHKQWTKRKKEITKNYDSAKVQKALKFLKVKGWKIPTKKEVLNDEFKRKFKPKGKWRDVRRKK